MNDSREAKREHFKSALWRRIYARKETVDVDEMAKEFQTSRRWCLYQAASLKRKKFANIERREIPAVPPAKRKAIKYFVSLPVGFTWSC